MKSRQWHRLTFSMPANYQDLLVGQLSLLGMEGFLQEDQTLHCFLPSARWKKPFEHRLHASLSRFGKEFPSLNLRYQQSIVKDQNWNRKWEQQAGIVETTDHICIKPSWAALRKKDAGKLILHIDPKMSFGTGHHETTRLTLKLIEPYLQPEMRVIDFGCGTGVLGIACAKLGAHSVSMIDNDPWTKPNVLENIKRNHVKHTATFTLGSASKLPRRRADLIVANIDYRTITRFLKTLKEHLRTAGIIIFSGILVTDIEVLLPVFQAHGLAPLEVLTENEWLALALVKT
ncbi:MAG TPA: 50S ribosomal protein L11 methyltransferase [Bacteroidota bacterium]|nr:50S ribosomal protein L11 methyltransferase [Bacteroidota bacterium]